MSDWRDLAKQGKFAEAEQLMLAETEKRTGYGDEVVTRAAFYEDWGDRAANAGESKALCGGASAFSKFRFVGNERRRRNGADAGRKPSAEENCGAKIKLCTRAGLVSIVGKVSPKMRAKCRANVLNAPNR